MNTNPSPRTIAPDDSLSCEIAMLDELQQLITRGLIEIVPDVDDTTEPRFYVTERGQVAREREDDERC